MKIIEQVPANRNCLLLDGNPADLEILKLAAGLAGADAIATASEVEALVALSDTRFDLLVVSLDLQGSGSTSFIKRLREKSALPILALSERLERTQVVRCLDAGADDILGKPFFVDELGARIRALLRRSALSSVVMNGVPTDRAVASRSRDTLSISLRDRPLQVRQLGPIKLDPFNKCASMGAKILPLTDGEFIVLEALAAKEGAIATRAELEGALYGNRDKPVTKVLDVFLGILRKKLMEALGIETSVILNHRNRGWSLRMDAFSSEPSPRTREGGPS